MKRRIVFKALSNNRRSLLLHILVDMGKLFSKRSYTSIPWRMIVVLCMAVAPCLQAQDSPASDFSDGTAIAQRLEQVQSDLQQHSPESDPLTHELLRRLERTIYQHQATVDLLASKESRRERALKATRNWEGFDEPGPFSVMFSDELRMRLISLQHLQTAAESRIRIVTQLIEDSANRLSAHQRNERQLTEMAETEDSAESRHQILVSMQQNDVYSRIEIERATHLELRQRSVQAELATYLTEQHLVELQLKSIEGKTTFSQSDLDKILGRITTERKQAFETLTTPAGPGQKANVRVAWLAEFLDAEEKFWETRYMALSTARLTEKKKALDTFTLLSQIVGAWIQAGKTMVDEQLLSTGETVQDKGRGDDLQRVKRFQNQIDFAISDLEGSAILGFLLLDRVLDAALAIWGAELYLVEDTASFEGQKVTTYRAITVGKLMQLAFILFVGWFALRFLSRRVRRLASRRPGSSHATANSIGRWTFGVGLSLLIIYGLKWVHIPFTAFAFLGGTLAIGIGFGAQTLIKNFISGFILILERPFKVGDFVEVDNVTGQIQRIGMRASVIEHFDGIETLVPNSALLDNRVDNWTFGKTAIRGSVKVGVAYGSS
jgi:hypothetical protein